ncbi:eukaryotic translation initiation factor 4E1 [Drosophila elegans]|uniref:eukaryotic translation initiation factor 4E1 n=1 Tax=Drosophila elegans TaxID=30023 RepID=UPI0007E627CE|nr:eukaryotic translation initiation factor 4E1 [Drosophila elegans]XP_017116066.1 eukaryotic translation initiation factor 4E1 [Drosophila elegans]XP_017116067.1 eukaryotic translation initiation factor 4E1 [Drosophila elegans]XP_017116068.1 eukaryotic translation initiation factor 4E1 [Drosophila elegans]
MIPNNFYKLKNFANPKTMFRNYIDKEENPSSVGLRKVEATVAAAAAVPQSNAASKNDTKMITTPAESSKKGKKMNKKGKKNQKQNQDQNRDQDQKNVPRTPSEMSKISEGHTVAKKNEIKNENSEDKNEVKERDVVQDNGQVKKSEVPQEESVQKKVTEKKLSPEQMLLEKNIEKKLSEQKKSMLKPSSTHYSNPTIESSSHSPTVQPTIEKNECQNIVDVTTNTTLTETGSLEKMKPLESDVSQYDDDDYLPEEMEAKGPHHPLNNCWTLWYLENDRTKSWEDMLHKVTSFDTVENFWSLVTHIKTPSELKLGSDYCLFKKGIRPMWEDEANVRGGRWVISVTKTAKNDLDNFWMDTMLCLIGEACDNSDELCGAVVNIRSKTNKISIWTADGEKEAAVLEIGSKLREGLHMDKAYVMQYELHKDIKVKQGSTIKNTYNL